MDGRKNEHGHGQSCSRVISSVFPAHRSSSICCPAAAQPSLASLAVQLRSIPRSATTTANQPVGRVTSRRHAGLDLIRRRRLQRAKPRPPVLPVPFTARFDYAGLKLRSPSWSKGGPAAGIPRRNGRTDWPQHRTIHSSITSGGPGRTGRGRCIVRCHGDRARRPAERTRVINASSAGYNTRCNFYSTPVRRLLQQTT